MEYILTLTLPVLLSAVLGYLLGSLSFSIILTKLFSKEDIRGLGSGNAGATNVLRSVGKLPAALTFLFDFIKCVLSVLLGYFIVKAACSNAGLPESLSIIGKYAAGFGCIFGHIFPLYFKFRGGKGVVTTAAMIALLDFRIFFPTILTFIIVFAVKRIVSLGSIIGVCMYPIYTFLISFFLDCELSPLHDHGKSSLATVISLTIASALIALIVIVVHRPNIKRLRKGEEKPISFHKKTL